MHQIAYDPIPPQSISARATRGQLDALGYAGLPWSWRLSLWIDALIILDEGSEA